VTSTTRYAKKAAEGRRRQERPHLPRRDEAAAEGPARRLRAPGEGKASVDAKKFVSDQTAYVARAARPPTRTTTECSRRPSRPTCGGPSRQPEELPGGDGWSGRRGPVEGRRGAEGAGDRRPSPRRHQLHAAFKRSRPTWRGDRRPQANKAFFNHLLFEATGTPYERDYPQYYTPAGLETFSPTTRAAAVSDLVGT